MVKKSKPAKLVCPDCGSDQVASESQQLFMVNTHDYYCESVKPHDDIARATCLSCSWEGKRADLTTEPTHE